MKTGDFPLRPFTPRVKKHYSGLEKDEQKRIKKALYELETDPFDPRLTADIKPLTATNPRKYRLRVGNFRVIYTIDNESVQVIEVFRRGKGY
ncbi:type II toxin-antitoxin system RelE/ParE family toxin [Methanogenium sp. MK-MG]|uniref:type II toxin-antitoxin system RelE family toxin n=1 Tax=Methanogenium sp. MK-MG TaxID=2599926 RepID=UPI00352AB515